MKSIHIEPTTKCSLRCPLCDRTLNLQHIKNIDCDIEIVSDITKEYDIVIMSGNHGDPIYHSNFHELISKIKEKNKSIKIFIDTNGSLRSKKWWEKTAQLLTKDDCITYSIDGDSFNNNIYRVNSKWKSIEDGVKSFRNKNNHTKLVWKYILFKYNENTIKNAVNLAKTLNFNSFILVESNRKDSKFDPNIKISDIFKNDLSTM